MAESKALDLDANKKPSQKKTLVLYGTIAFLLVALSVTSTLLYVRVAEDGPVRLKPEVKQPIYLPLETLVVNFGGPTRSRYLQVDLQLMTREPKVIDAVQAHMPVIRNDILLLLSNQTAESVSGVDGKAALREEISAAIQRVLDAQAEIRGEAPPGTVEAVYFTSFVMQ